MPPTLAETLALSDTLERRLNLTALGARLAAAGGAEQVFAALGQIADARERQAFLAGAFEILAKGDESAALNAAAQLPRGPDRDAALTALADSWTDKNLSPKARAQAIARGGTERGLGEMLLTGYSPRHERAVAWAQTLLTGEAYLGLLEATAFHLAVTGDPRRAVELTTAGLAGEERDRVLAEIAGGWSLSDPQAAWTWAQTLPAGSGRERAMSATLSRWAEGTSPRAAAGLLGALPPGDARTEAITAIADHWAAADTAAALDWMRNLAAPADRAAAQRGVDSSSPQGIGVTMRVNEEGHITVADLVPGGPVARAGLLRSGDRILAVEAGANGGWIETRQQDLTEVTRLIRGPSGSIVRLRVASAEPGAAARIVEVTREQVLLKNRRARVKSHEALTPKALDCGASCTALDGRAVERAVQEAPQSQSLRQNQTIHGSPSRRSFNQKSRGSDGTSPSRPERLHPFFQKSSGTRGSTANQSWMGAAERIHSRRPPARFAFSSR